MRVKEAASEKFSRGTSAESEAMWRVRVALHASIDLEQVEEIVAFGAEFGIGPNITPAGVALALASGVTFRAGNPTVPMNVAVVPSKVGTRISILPGFNMRRR